jgi:hypothetical protein
MTTRTVKFLGLAYGSIPAEITVTVDGNTIYTGTVTTADSPVPSLPDPELSATTEFCEFEIPMEFSGTLPVTCTVNSGTVIFAQITANYCVIANTNPVVGAGPKLFLGVNGAGDARSNVFIDGVAQTPNYTEGLAGTWWFRVSAGSVLTHDLVVSAGTANLPPPPSTP